MRGYYSFLTVFQLLNAGPCISEAGGGRGEGGGMGLNRGMLRRPRLSVAPVEDGLLYSTLKRRIANASINKGIIVFAAIYIYCRSADKR
jgi:hypothetical protein